MKTKLLLLFFVITIPYTFGNMASPWSRGTFGASPFINQYVEIQKEQIKIKLDSTFEEASYEINYVINATKEGLNIPLLFLALEYKKDFQIWLDGNLVELKNFPSNYYSKTDSNKTKGFNYFLGEEETVEIPFNEKERSIEKLSNLKYFEVDLSLGLHRVKIKYVARPWVFSGDWVKKYSFRYSLYPAKYWKNFEQLEIELTVGTLLKKIETNLSVQNQDLENGRMSWEFDQIPTETLEIRFTPEVNKKALFLIAIGPYYISLMMLALLVLGHFVLAKNYRKKSSAKYSWVAILGSIVNPFLMYLTYIYAVDYIGYLIGEHASNRMGYGAIFAIFFYPVNVLLYLVIAWQLDNYWKRKKGRLA